MEVSVVVKRKEDYNTLYEKFLKHSNLEKKDYQYAGIKWIVNNEVNGVHGTHGNVKGGFISDEMGLGKTIMMVGSMFVNFLPKTLIVLPVALIDQWVSQIYKTTGHKALVFYGAEKKNLNLSDLERRPIVITSYNSLSFQKGKESDGLGEEGGLGGGGKGCLLHQIKWNRVVFDEAHHLRNSKTRRYISCNMLKSDIRWIISGTPIQNKMKDFETLCGFIGLSHHYFKDRSNIPNFILKRTKKQVGINLPDVVSDCKVVKWKSEAEKNISSFIHSHVFVMNNDDCNNVYSELSFRNTYNPYCKLISILRARQFCVLPRLVIKGIEYDNDNDISDHVLLDSNEKEGFRSTSKIDSVVSLLLSRKDNGNGKLVFCHFREEMDELFCRLKSGGIDNVAILDGRCSKKTRNELLNKKSDVLILQIKTGCEGLNLQDNFNEVYFVTPHWNPKIEDQAVARCHRIGQKKEVYVFRFHMSGFYNDDEDVVSPSIENYINDVQNKKREIISEIIED